MYFLIQSSFVYAPSTRSYSDPAEKWALYFILVGSFALILGLTNWRLGLWLKEYDVRWLNIFSGIAGIIIGLILIYG